MISQKRNARIKEIEGAIVRVSILLNRLEKKNSRAGWIRFYIIIIGLILFLIPYFYLQKNIALINLFAVVVLFLIASTYHNKISALIVRYKKWIEIKKSNLARLRLDWENIPVPKIFTEYEPNPVEVDLDITGNRSLHQLIDTAKSKEGSELLREYLITAPVSRVDIIHKQNLVKELFGLSHFRDKFLLASALSSKNEINAGFLTDWLATLHPSNRLLAKFGFLSVLAVINIAFILLAIYQIVPKVFLITGFTYVFFYFYFQKSIRSYVHDAELLKDEMKKIIGILSFIENYNFGNRKNLIELSSAFNNKGDGPTKQLNRINKILSFLTFRANPVLWFIISMLTPIEYYLSYKIEKLKRDLGDNLQGWLDVWHKFECFVSLSNYAYLNPDYYFPEILEDNSKFKFTASELGHPLIPYEHNIKNNFEISGLGSIALITGSNMSGKSTFLRTIGINTCLAYNGAPVNAKLLSINLTRVFTCIKVNDSVVDGISYFYAEVKRLKKLLDEIERENEKPVMFLIDEIFKGTNNIERNKGSRAILKSLVNKNGAGLISTHDLDLIKLADEIPSITNYHFRESVDGDEMIFDYKLHEGPCPTTNALKIMKQAGLPID